MNLHNPLPLPRNSSAAWTLRPALVPKEPHARRLGIITASPVIPAPCALQAAQNIDFKEGAGAREGASSRLAVKEEAVSASEAAALEATATGAAANRRR